MTLSRNAEDQERLIAFVRQALERMDRGEPIDARELCQEHPHLAVPLAEVLGLNDELTALQQEALREDPLAGLLLADRYQLTECRGRGAMGVVYHAEDRELRRDVAIKILDARLFRDDQAEQRFQREAEALATLQHGNIVSVFDRGRTPEGIHFLVMELLEGVTLAGLIERVSDGVEPLAAVASCMGEATREAHWPRLCANWGLDLALGLQAAHERDLVHRDVKPSNVFLAKPGRPVLLDFGIAARVSDERLTATQTTLGTPWYMPPEQIGAGNLLAAAPALDIYGIGATLYHLLAGRPPYVGDAATVLAALSTQDPTPLASVRADVPRDLIAIVEKCLEREPTRRYASASDLADDLRAFLSHQPVRARPLTAMKRRLRQWRRSPARPIAVIAVTLTLLVAAIAGPILWRQHEQDVQTRKNKLYRELPTLVAIEGWPDERVLSELRGEHQQAIAQLDRILELDAQDLPVRLWRACLYLDLDDRTAAAKDLDAIATHGDSKFFRQLAQRYRNSDPQKHGSLAIDLDKLPQANTPQENYVAGFHELRNRQVKGYASRAYKLLSEAAEDYLPARDLRLLALAALAEQTGRRDIAKLLYDETIALEALYGTDTARTQTMRGVALLLQGRYEEAIRPFERSLELRPGRHSPHQNLANALKRCDRPTEAMEHLQEALRLRPFAWNSKYTLAQLVRDQGELERAYELAQQLTKTGQRGEAWKHPRLVGSIAIAEAMSLLRSDQTASRQAAQRAMAAFAESLEVRNSKVVRQEFAVAEALAAETDVEAMRALSRAMLDKPDHPYQLATLAFFMPKHGLDEELTGYLSVILRQLASKLAKGDQALQQRLAEEIGRKRATFR